MRLKKELMPRCIIGPRIILRPVRLDDAEIITAAANDPVLREKLCFFSFFQDSPTIERETAYLKRMINSESDLLMVIESEYDHRFIGTIGLHELDLHNDNLRLGIIIFNKYFWRQGYAREALNLLLDFAFNGLGMNKVYLNPRADNKIAIRIYKKLGFKQEGILRQEYKVKVGHYLDMLRMSILKDEWLKERRI